MKFWPLMCVILIALIPFVTTLNCYVCHSDQDPACENAGQLASFAKSCKETEEPYCRKIIQKVDQKTSTIRTCGSKVGNKLCYKTAGTHTTNVCSCNEDLCNSADRFNGQQRLLTIISSTVALVITVVLLR